MKTTCPCSEKELRRFLAEAKRATFAGAGERLATSERGGWEYKYSEGDFGYRDRYFGSVFDIGQEIVWFRMLPVWGMNYHGGMVDGFENLAKECFSFLKRALLLVTEDFPYRGPTAHEEGRWLYTMSCLGSIWSFDGRESVQYDGRTVYERRLHGGVVYD